MPSSLLVCELHHVLSLLLRLPSKHLLNLDAHLSRQLLSLSTRPSHNAVDRDLPHGESLASHRSVGREDFLIDDFFVTSLTKHTLKARHAVRVGVEEGSEGGLGIFVHSGSYSHVNMMGAKGVLYTYCSGP